MEFDINVFFSSLIDFLNRNLFLVWNRCLLLFLVLNSDRAARTYTNARHSHPHIFIHSRVTKMHLFWSTVVFFYSHFQMRDIKGGTGAIVLLANWNHLNSFIHCLLPVLQIEMHWDMITTRTITDNDSEAENYRFDQQTMNKFGLSSIFLFLTWLHTNQFFFFMWMCWNRLEIAILNSLLEIEFGNNTKQSKLFLMYSRWEELTITLCVCVRLRLQTMMWSIEDCGRAKSHEQIQLFGTKSIWIDEFRTKHNERVALEWLH